MLVALYARVSTDRQAEHDLSIPDQLNRMRDWSRQNGHEVVTEFIELGASATDERRPILNQMLSEAVSDQHPFDAILVHSFSRFFRDSVEFALWERRLVKHSVRIVSITQPFGDTGEGMLARRMVSLFDEYSSQENAKHVLRAMQENARRGFFNGSRPPYGYTVVETDQKARNGLKRKLAINPQEADIVKTIFELSLEGDQGKALGVKAIAEYLNERGLYYRGKLWRHQAIHRVLTSRTYVGDYVFNRRSARTGLAKPASEQVVTPIEAIVCREIFERVAAALQERRPHENYGLKALNVDTLLTGLAKCGHCGKGMVLMTGKGGRYRYYRCATRFHSGVKLCAAPNFPAERLEQLVLDRLAEKVLEPTRIRATLEKAFADLEEHRKADDARVRVLASEQGLASERLARLYEAVETGGLRTDSNLAERIAMYQKKHQHLAGQIAEIKRRHRIPLKKFGDNHVLAFAGAMRDKILQPDSRIAKPYMRLLVKEIRVFGDRIRLEGSNAALASAISRTELGTEGSVPSFVSEWRARQDSNPRPPGS